MSGREITYNCPACTMVFFGPWVICHMCGYSKLEAARKRGLQLIAEDFQDLVAELKADNDAFDWKQERRQIALENARLDDASDKADPDAAWRAQPIDKDAPVWGASERRIDDEWNQGD